MQIYVVIIWQHNELSYAFIYIFNILLNKFVDSFILPFVCFFIQKFVLIKPYQLNINFRGKTLKTLIKEKNMACIMIYEMKLSFQTIKSLTIQFFIQTFFWKIVHTRTMRLTEIQKQINQLIKLSKMLMENWDIEYSIYIKTKELK